MSDPASNSWYGKFVCNEHSSLRASYGKQTNLCDQEAQFHSLFNNAVGSHTRKLFSKFIIVSSSHHLFFKTAMMILFVI